MDTFKRILDLVQQGREGEARLLAGEQGIDQAFVDEALHRTRPSLPNDKRAAKAAILRRLAGKTPRRRSDEFEQPDFFDMWDAGEESPLDKMIEQSWGDAANLLQEEEEPQPEVHTPSQAEEAEEAEEEAAQEEAAQSKEEEEEGNAKQDLLAIKRELEDLSQEEVDKRIKQEMERTIEKGERTRQEILKAIKELKSLAKQEEAKVEKIEKGSEGQANNQIQIEKYKIHTEYFHKIKDQIEKINQKWTEFLKQKKELERLKDIVSLDTTPKEEQLEQLDKTKKELEETNRLVEEARQEERRKEQELSKLHKQLHQVKQFNLFKAPTIERQQQQKEQTEREKQGEEIKLNFDTMDTTIKIDEKANQIAKDIMNKE